MTFPSHFLAERLAGDPRSDFRSHLGSFEGDPTCVSYAFLQVETHVGIFLHGAPVWAENPLFGGGKATQKAHIGLASAPPGQHRHSSLQVGGAQRYQSSLQGHVGTGIGAKILR